MEIRGKVALVTGAAGGIGRATAVALGRGGACVVVVDIDGGRVEETAGLVVSAGGRAAALRTDVADAADLERALGRAEADFGGLDILCNNAGVGTLGGFPAAPAASWKRVVDVNLGGVILGTQLALPCLRRRGGGVIVNTASLAGFVGFPPDPVYAATKAGVVLFTHSLAHLKAEGIRVNCVCPGLVDTALLRASVSAGGGRPAWLDVMPMLTPEDVAEGILQLVEDDELAGRAMRIVPGLRDFAPLPEFPASLD